MTLAAAALLAASSLLTRSQQDSICYSFADLGVAAIEAREAGVPINKALSVIDEIEHREPLLKPFIPIFRDGIIKAYADPPLNLGPMSKRDRQQLINRFTAECIRDEFPAPAQDEGGAPPP